MHVKCKYIGIIKCAIITNNLIRTTKEIVQRYDVPYWILRFDSSSIKDYFDHFIHIQIKSLSLYQQSFLVVCLLSFNDLPVTCIPPLILLNPLLSSASLYLSTNSFNL